MVTEKRCVRCGDLIPAKRVEALPKTRLCFECSEAVGGDYILKVTSSNTGKSNSLKKNYGAWKIDWVWRDIAPIKQKGKRR